MYLPILMILSILLLIACWQDYHDYRINNKLILTGALLGISLNTFLFTQTGFLDSLAGLGLGLLLLLPLYLLRVMGAGDVKLLAMTGAFVGQNDIFGVFLYTLIAGGLLALMVLLRRGFLRRIIDNAILMCLLALSTPKSEWLKGNSSFSIGATGSSRKLPYAFAITTGAGFFLMQKHLQ
ncbi:MAG: prepilin peptidase [Nitrosomonas sp.]|nr:MAG: prepilin peptidase [Nitrosomonas sp.]